MLGIDDVLESSVFDVYDDFLVPLVFQTYADEVAERLAHLRAGAVLEVAAGTGVVTRALASSLPDDVTITATDIVPGMLERAQRIGTARPVRWEQANALALPYENSSFDVVVCQFGAMFFDPRGDAYAEMGRVLRPGGTLVVSVWDALPDNEFAEAVHDALQLRFPDAPPQFLAMRPYGYHDRATIAAELASAGFGDVSVDRVEAVSGADSPLAVAAGFCAGTPVRDQLEGRGRSRLVAALDAASEAVAARFGAVAPEARMSAQVVTVRR